MNCADHHSRNYNNSDDLRRLSPIKECYHASHPSVHSVGTQSRNELQAPSVIRSGSCHYPACCRLPKVGYDYSTMESIRVVTRLSSLRVRDPQLITDLSTIKENLHTAPTNPIRHATNERHQRAYDFGSGALRDNIGTLHRRYLPWF